MSSPPRPSRKNPVAIGMAAVLLAAAVIASFWVPIYARATPKLGAFPFFWLPKAFSINLQLLGGIWILQTFPAIVVGLYTRWLHRWALVLGWAAAMTYGTVMAYRQPTAGEPGTHFGASTAMILGHTMYIAVAALVINLVVSVVLTAVFRALRLPQGADETSPAHYLTDAVPAPARVPVAGPTATEARGVAQIR
jgi:solute:Na+ symporter, SSS family